jgi:hypothetical protein
MQNGSTQSNQFFGYASKNWGYHARNASTLGQVLTEVIVDFLKSEAKVNASSQGLLVIKHHSSDLNYRQQIPKRMTGLRLTAYFGLEEVLALLRKNGHDPVAKDTCSRTPLSWAAERGHDAVVKQLLEKGAELESTDNKHSRTPLSWATYNGHEAVVQLLLEQNAELEAKENTWGLIPLSRAALYGHKAVVKLLLEKGAELESVGNKVIS